MKKLYMLENGQGRVVTDPNGYPRRFEVKPSGDSLKEWYLLVTRKYPDAGFLRVVQFVDGQYNSGLKV